MDELAAKTICDMAVSTGLSPEELKKRMAKLIHRFTTDKTCYLHHFQKRFYGTEEPSPEEWIKDLISIMVSDRYSISDKAYACTAFYMAGDPHVIRDWFE